MGRKKAGESVTIARVLVGVFGDICEISVRNAKGLKQNTQNLFQTNGVGEEFTCGGLTLSYGV